MTRPGRLIAVVGPSGVGKDTILRALARRRPDLHLVRRVITRDANAGGEAFDAANPDRFAAMEAAGAFALSWSAHGLSYGIPAAIDAILAAGGDAAANLSRGVLDRAAQRFPRLVVLSVTARPETLAARLAGRGREDAAQIARRLARRACDPPPGVPVVMLSNDGPIDATVEAALSALYPDRTAAQ